MVVRTHKPVRPPFVAFALMAGLAAPGLAQAQFEMTPASMPVASDMSRGALSGSLSPSERSTLSQALDTAARRDLDGTRTLQMGLTDPVARKLVLWAMVRYCSDKMAEDELSAALHELWTWPPTSPGPGTPSTGWNEQRRAINAALSSMDYQGAYNIAASAMLPPGADKAEAEFYAGWLALKKLNDPRLADRHFAAVGQAGTSPITQSRALYWRGRAADAMGDTLGAQVFYGQAARYNTTFYGQLAAEKAGDGEMVLGKDPVPTRQEVAGFEAQEAVRAAHMLASLGQKDMLKLFVLSLAEKQSTPADYVQLVDLARDAGEQFLSMQVVRAAARKGVVLPERGYPVSRAARASGGLDPAFVHGIIRQESSFDPSAHSGAGARGMMQLMPATASKVARAAGVDYSPYMLENADYNVKLGVAYLNSMTDTFSGSYIMAAAAYNAGPDRPASWVGYCGDPRSPSTDALDFIECIPFSETRNYVMRVLEAMEVYRARLNGGRAQITLAKDIKRGTYSYVPGSYVAPAQTQALRVGPPVTGQASMAPIPDPPSTSGR